MGNGKLTKGTKSVFGFRLGKVLAGNSGHALSVVIDGSKLPRIIMGIKQARWHDKLALCTAHRTCLVHPGFGEVNALAFRITPATDTLRHKEKVELEMQYNIGIESDAYW